MAYDQSYRPVYNVLAMSYYDLPYYLKPCFLHLGNFPENYEIYAKKLYRMWIAEGIIASPIDRTLGKISLEQKAQYCLNELVEKYMVQVKKVGSKGRIKTCCLHNLIREVCLDIGKEENFICMMDLNQTNQNEPLLELNKRLRRLAIYIGEKANASLPKFLFKKASKIRSLLFFFDQDYEQLHCSRLRSVCNEFQLLRVLDLNGYNIKGSLPKEIKNLIYLRFLSLNRTRVTKVSSSIGYLGFLETLDLRVFHVVVTLPNVLWKLRQLKHLYFPSREVSTKQGYVIKRGEMMRLDGLQYLETLKNVDMDRVEFEGLNELKNMRKLTISRVSKKKNLDPFLKSSSIKHLSLEIDGSIVSENPEILSNCHPLHRLVINNGIHGPLRLEMFPKNLLRIELFNCEVGNDPMLVFERLPRLENLKLENCYGGTEMECSAGGFTKLTELAIINLSNLREWKVGAGALPNLKSIFILSSSNLVLPDVLPRDVEIYCNPCVKGIERYNWRCPYNLEQSE
ncbi:hypothetical protein Nepgr_024581 [Nepenthes gracilis]|uniref:Uncharacterized protein n=1 Tax=Nepenthes gracilis TaxID=150966 RepID=A0AAD3XYX9_NEPGR|nr:hypothetical protein Nepgr_024581 [Nepenthes gracilis]